MKSALIGSHCGHLTVQICRIAIYIDFQICSERGLQMMMAAQSLVGSTGGEARGGGAMELVRLGVSDLMVSRLCLGTMLFGEGLDYKESSAQLDAAAEHGINFFDSAEMYPVPQRAETQGRSEEFLGRWLRQSAVSRDKRVIATKVAGPSAQMPWLRGGPSRVDARNILAALEGSLSRLETDYVDLYQIHWPDRYVPMFGDTDFDPAADYADVTSIEEQLRGLETAVRQGKVRYVGLSNETAWGLHSFLSCSSNSTRHTGSSSAAVQSSAAHGTERDASLVGSARVGSQGASTSSEAMQQGGASSITERRSAAAGQRPTPPECQGLPRVISVQNAYSLLCRNFDSTMAESCYREHVCLLPYSPLAMGLLSGKYHDTGGEPAGAEARLVKYRSRYAEAEGRYPIEDPRVSAAVRAYASIARKHGILPAVLALAFVLRHPLVPSVVIGARNILQLDDLVQAVGVRLPQEVVDEIDQVHRMWPNPTP